jgi:hypothetical protein
MKPEITANPAGKAIIEEKLREQFASLVTAWQSKQVPAIEILEQLRKVRQELEAINCSAEYLIRVLETITRVALDTPDVIELRLCLRHLQKLYKTHSSSHKVVTPCQLART